MIPGLLPPSVVYVSNNERIMIPGLLPPSVVYVSNNEVLIVASKERTDMLDSGTFCYISRKPNHRYKLHLECGDDFIIWDSGVTTTLKAWAESYFDSKGLKVEWLAPSNDGTVIGIITGNAAVETVPDEDMPVVPKQVFPEPNYPPRNTIVHCHTHNAYHIPGPHCEDYVYPSKSVGEPEIRVGKGFPDATESPIL